MAAAHWAESEDGHRWIARRVEEIISGQIRGHLEIGQVDRADLHHIAARDVVFSDESGREVIRADKADLTYDFEQLLRGRFVSYGGRVHGGRVRLETLGHELLLDRAFRSSHPGPPGQPVGQDVVHLENLEVDDVSLSVHLGDAPVAVFRRLSAVVLVRAPDRGAAIVAADAVSGRLHVAAPIPFDLRVAGASFLVDGASPHRVQLDLPSHMGTERIGVEVSVRASPDQQLFVDARLRPHGLGAMLAASGMISQALIAETQSPQLDVTVEMQ